MPANTATGTVLCLFGILAVLCAAPVHAQWSIGSSLEGAPSFSPGPYRAAVGLSPARASFRLPCLAAGDCESQYLSGHPGQQKSRAWSVELASEEIGSVTRTWGSARTQGLSLSLVGRAPVLGSPSVSLYGRVGTTLGTLEANGPGAAQWPGARHGLGLAYGAGVSMAFTPRLSASFGWESHDVRFGIGPRDNLRSTSLGLQWRY